MTQDAPRLASAKLATLALLGFSLVVIYFCYRILNPFFSVFCWALAISVVASPLYSKVRQKIPSRGVAALVTVALVSFLILVPLTLLISEVAKEAATTLPSFIEALENGNLERTLQRNSYSAPIMRWVKQNVDLKKEVNDLLESANRYLPNVFAFSVGSVVELMLVFFTTFFLFRDRVRVLEELRQFIPLTERETDYLFSQVSDTIYATLNGSLVVACVQGILGGFIFWLLGIPGAILWGMVMALLGLLPYAGAFLIWIPAAIILFFQGMVGKALVLVLWGSLVVGLIDNMLYPILVGKRMHFHTLPIFFFVLGGFAFFGASGLILGPVTLSIAMALLDTWKQRLRRSNLNMGQRPAVAAL